jgi:hypothetical protein
MRFGLIHRIMTNLLATLGILALVTSGELGRATSTFILLGLAVAIVLPERWQTHPVANRVATIAPLLVLALQIGRLACSPLCCRLFAWPRAEERPKTSRSSSSPGFTSSQGPSSAGASPMRSVSWRFSSLPPAPSSCLTCDARSKGTIGKGRVTEPGSPLTSLGFFEAVA